LESDEILRYKNIKQIEVLELRDMKK